MKHLALSITMLLLLVASNMCAAENSGRLDGTIVSRNTSTNQLTVTHVEVKGLMGAMTMSYEVRGQKVASLPKDGAKITGTLHQSSGAFWLTDVKAAEQQPALGHAMNETPAEHSMSGMPMQHQPEQREHSGMQHGEPAMQHGGMQDMTMSGDATSDFLMRQASGTSFNPAAAPMHMSMWRRGDWMLMLHGLAFVNQVVQSGPRGGDKLFSTNWIMGMADRPLGGGHLILRSMLSLEPATVGDQYPELFQTGEALHGRPIVDAQHPHDFFMELAAEYAHPLGDTTIGYVYAAPTGDPSLGPVAYPHRASASEIPQAALSHHVQDSTHIAASVLTIGAQRGSLGFSVSGFRGAEPDEKRWNVEHGKIDSWAARFTFDPSPNWTAQISTGHLEHPEALEPGDIQRTTASVSYSGNSPLGRLDSSFLFGHNDKSEGHDTSAWLAEAVLEIADGNYVTGRAELVDKDELFAGDDAAPPSIAHDVFRIKALTLGYSRDVFTTRALKGAVGANVTLYSLPRAIQPFYGSSPHSFYLFVRLRGGDAMQHGHSTHTM